MCPEYLCEASHASVRYVVAGLLALKDPINQLEVLGYVIWAVSDDVGSADVAVPRSLVDSGGAALAVGTIFAPVANYHVCLPLEGVAVQAGLAP